MPAYKDKNRGKWYVSFYYENYNGVREKKMKRGFDTKKDALEWEREFLRQAKADFDMKFETFVEIYVDKAEIKRKYLYYKGKYHLQKDTPLFQGQENERYNSERCY